MKSDFETYQQWVWNKHNQAKRAYHYAPDSKKAKQLWAIAKTAEARFKKWKEDNGWKQDIIF